MTVQVDAAEIVTAIEVAAWVGSMLALLVIGLIVYLMVRPSRRREATPPEADPVALEQMLRLMERMEQRLEVLERVMDQDANTRDRNLQAGERPELRRMK